MAQPPTLPGAQVPARPDKAESAAQSRVSSQSPQKIAANQQLGEGGTPSISETVVAAPSGSGQTLPGAPGQAPNVVRDGDWVRAQPAGHYTVQLLAGRELGALLEFANRHDVAGDLAYFQGMRQDREWYSLVCGVYATPQEALQAARLLSKKLGIAEPWVRSFKSIQESLVPRGPEPSDAAKPSPQEPEGRIAPAAQSHPGTGQDDR